MPSITRGGSSCFLGLSEDWNVYGHWFQVNFYDVMDMHSCSRSENPPSQHLCQDCWPQFWAW
ncbi:cytochrome p450 [Moniliophthora roreri]|nr:cytochrome p450 [Moniliophthora roreri]